MVSMPRSILRIVGASSARWARVPSCSKSLASSMNISLVSSGKRPDCVSLGFASTCRSFAMADTSGAFVNVEPPVTTHSSPRSRIASM